MSGVVSETAHVETASSIIWTLSQWCIDLCKKCSAFASGTGFRGWCAELRDKTM